MKKDELLERELEGYIDGSVPPGESVTERAKNCIREKNGAKTPVFKRAMIAVAGFATACASAIGLYFLPIAGGGVIDKGDGIGSTQTEAPGANGSASNSNSATPLFYSAQNLSVSEASIYAPDRPKGIEFLERFDLASNCSLDAFAAYSDGENIAFVKAELSGSFNLSRHDAVIYAEYAEENSACELFEEYYAGARLSYGAHDYLYAQSYENGEYVSKAYILKDGVKYYISVQSSDAEAYMGYLKIILK